MRKEDEAVAQQSMVIWFNNNFCLKFHKPRLIIHSIPNGIAVDGLPDNERAKVLDKMTKTGMLKGAPDLNIKGVKGRVLEVEIKTSTGKQSEDQIDYERRIIELGGRYELARSLDQFKEKIYKNINWLLGNE